MNFNYFHPNVPHFSEFVTNEEDIFIFQLYYILSTLNRYWIEQPYCIRVFNPGKGMMGLVNTC